MNEYSDSHADREWLANECSRELLSESGDPQFRAMAASTLGTLAEDGELDSICLSALLQGCSDSSALVRASAAEALGWVSNILFLSNDACPSGNELRLALYRLASDESKSVREAARASLARIADRKTPTETMTRLLERLHKQLGASVCRVFVSHPVFEGHFRLVASTGDVRYPQFDHGIVFPPAALTAKKGRESALFTSDAAGTAALRNKPPEEDLAGLLANMAEKNPLYGDFIAREGIVSCARLQSRHDNGHVRAALFVNFRERFTFPRAARDAIRSAFGKMVQNLQGCENEILQEGHALGARLDVSFVPRSQPNSFFFANDVLREGLRNLIESNMIPSGFPADGLIGTIHIYDPKSQTLTRRAFYPERKASDRMEFIDLKNPSGLIAYCALRRIAVVANNVQRSEFGSIYQVLRFATRSEMVIPLLDGPRLVGVLNLESTRPDAFSDRLILPLAWTASQIAKRYVRALLESRLERLESINFIGALHPTGSDPLQFIVEAVSKELKFPRCDIWIYDKSRDHFVRGAASYRRFRKDIPPRAGGWTGFIAKNSCPVFLNCADSDKLRAYRWINNDWISINGSNGAPDSVHGEVIELGVKSELGIPLLVRRECVGVLWLKYDDKQTEPPDPYWIAQYMEYAEEAGWLVDRVAV